MVKITKASGKEHKSTRVIQNFGNMNRDQVITTENFNIIVIFDTNRQHKRVGVGGNPFELSIALSCDYVCG